MRVNVWLAESRARLSTRNPRCGTLGGVPESNSPSASPASVVPRILTRRLLLREFRRSDFDAYAASLAVRVQPPGPVDRRTAWRMFTSCTGGWVLDGAGWWCIELLETKEFVGSCGAFFREAHPERETTAQDLELGWTVQPEFRGRGFAKEAAAAALAFGFETLGACRAIAHIDADNLGSIRVGESIGMRFAREVAYYDERLRLYTIERPDHR